MGYPQRWRADVGKDRHPLDRHVFHNLHSFAWFDDPLNTSTHNCVMLSQQPWPQLPEEALLVNSL